MHTIKGGVSKQKLNDYDGAIADFTSAIALKPNLINALNNRGLARQDLKDDHEAIADFTRVIALNPQLYKCL